MFSIITLLGKLNTRIPCAWNLPGVTMPSCDSFSAEKRIFKAACIKAEKNRNKNYYRDLRRLKKYHLL